MVYIYEYVAKLIKGYRENGNIIIAYDFDDTVSPYSEFSTDYTSKVRTLIKRANDTGKFRFILWTCRERDRLEEAKNFCVIHDLPFEEVNRNLQDLPFANYRKVYCNLILDDKCGLPMILIILVVVIIQI